LYLVGGYWRNGMLLAPKTRQLVGNLVANNMNNGSDEKMYDGYQAIQSSNSSSSREEELRKMEEARMKNCAKA
jgi:hypothetical protein